MGVTTEDRVISNLEQSRYGKIVPKGIKIVEFVMNCECFSYPGAINCELARRSSALPVNAIRRKF